MIIDTHVHIWNLQRSSYAWLEHADPLLRTTYDLNMLAPSIETTGVNGGVLVQADITWEDTELMLETARSSDWVKGVVGWLPLTDVERTAELLETVVSREPYFKGVRHLIHDEQDDRWLLQPQVIESLKLLATHGIPYDVVGIKVNHIRTALQVAEQVPELRMVFDHLNQPSIASNERFGEWGIWMKEAAKHSNFYVKISGMGTTAGKHNFSADNVKPYIEFALNEFGTERCFCGGDWPVSLLASDYETVWNIYKKAINDLISEEEVRRGIYSDNAIAFYNLSL